MRTTALFLVSILVACGGTVVDIDGGSDGSVQDSPTCGKCIDAAPFSCGNTECSGTDAVCIHPCCGGAKICAPLEDGGCPSGLSLSQQCPPDMPCTNECLPASPYCGTTSDCSQGTGHDCYLLCN